MLHVVPAPPPGEEPLTFEQIYRRYSRYVAAVVLRLDPGVPDLDDVVQDVFLAAAGGLRRLRDPNATKAVAGDDRGSHGAAPSPLAADVAVAGNRRG